MANRRIVIAGGGAAGFFAAIACAEAAGGGTEVILLEKGAHFLAKVRISGGGRCNVTHACFEPRELTERYPRGKTALISPFHRFQATDTVDWFAAHGVELKTESDGRMFPATDSSETIIRCLTQAAEDAGVQLCSRRGIERVTARAGGGFDLALAGGEIMECDRLLLATGGCRAGTAGELAVSLGHSLEAPVPSLFSFHIETAWLRELSGVSVEAAEVSVPGTKLRETGPMLMTHLGLSGPAILRISAWGARVLHGMDYAFPLRVNWLPGWGCDQIVAELRTRRQTQPAALIGNSPMEGLPGRLWKQLVAEAWIAAEERWSTVSREGLHRLAEHLCRSEFQVSGKSPNKAEFVTCGGVRLREVDFKTMESRICPGLYFAGELLDIDGITGGFNFQAAWTTGWIAGNAMAEEG